MAAVRFKSIRTRLFLLAGVIAIGTLGYGVCAWQTLSDVKVNGPYYQRINQSKDLLADVLPPPGYVVEPYLLAHLMAGAKTPAELDARAARYNELKAEYYSRLAYWRQTLPNGTIKELFAEGARLPAEAFFAAIDQELIPALRRGDREAATAVLEHKLPPVFAEHRAAIDRVTAMATERATAEEVEVAAKVADRQAVLIGLAALLLVVTTGAVAWLGVSITRPVNQTMHVLEAVASGDLSRRAEVRSADELGRMAAALDTAIDALRAAEEAKRLQAERDRRLAEEQAERDRRQAEQDRRLMEEKVVRERQQAEQARQQAEQERQRVERQAEKDREEADARLREAEELRSKVDELLAVVSAAAAGDLTQEVSVGGDDAIGRVGEGLGTFLEDLRGNMRQIAAHAVTLAGASEELSTVSRQMSGHAESTSAEAGSVASAAEHVSKSVQTVAQAAEEMSASIRDIAKHSAEAARVVSDGVRAAEQTGTIVSQLGESSSEIGKVLKVITSIAEQTNLLASI